ncbi:MAG: ATP synthase F0 subunit B [Gemmatimonadales bacterium]|nr:MAG: ATP synthase F0 subunit B [Gemmatimonadales bacterium]
MPPLRGAPGPIAGARETYMKIPGSAALPILLAAPAPLFAADEGGGLFALDPGLAIWTIVVFLLVLFVLGKFAWGPILGQVEAREQSIRGSIDEARELQEKAQALMEEHRRQLADARRQSQELLNEGREAGERLRREVEDKARSEADNILARARSEIEREKERAMESIREQSVDLAMAAAARLLGQKLDAQADRELIRDYLSQVEPVDVASSSRGGTGRPAAEA